MSFSSKAAAAMPVLRSRVPQSQQGPPLSAAYWALPVAWLFSQVSILLATFWAKLARDLQQQRHLRPLDPLLDNPLLPDTVRQRLTQHLYFWLLQTRNAILVGLFVGVAVLVARLCNYVI